MRLKEHEDWRSESFACEMTGEKNFKKAKSGVEKRKRTPTRRNMEDY